jgi:hypothetical protein
MAIPVLTRLGVMTVSEARMPLALLLADAIGQPERRFNTGDGRGPPANRRTGDG